MNQGNALENAEICSEKWVSPHEERYFHLSFAWQFQQGQKTQIKSFCNNISTNGGGTHQEGFESGLVKVCQEWIKERYPNLKVNILKSDVLESLTAVVAVRMQGQIFAGQTKDRLANKNVREIVKGATYDLVQKFLQDHGGTAEAVSQKVIETAQNRAKTEEYQESLREGVRTASLPGKLAPCISKEVANNELFIVEGMSAGGSAKAARFPENQAILPVQGKILNVLKAK